MNVRMVSRVLLSTLSCLACLNSQLDALELRLSLQDSYATKPTVTTRAATAHSVSNRVWAMSGHALLQHQDYSLEEYLNFSEDEIRKRLKKYLSNQQALNPLTDDLILLDLEHPVHAAEIGEHPEEKQLRIIEAFKKRIKVARQELPNAKFSLYGVIMPDAQGNSSSDRFKKMMRGFMRASQLGMFDDMAYLSPVLYLRGAPGEKLYRSMETYTRQGIEVSRSVKTSKGTPIPLAPLLGFKVYSRRSARDRQCLPAESLQKQLKIIQEYPYVETVILWAGKDDTTTCSPQKVVEALSTNLR